MIGADWRRRDGGGGGGGNWSSRRRLQLVSSSQERAHLVAVVVVPLQQSGSGNMTLFWRRMLRPRYPQEWRVDGLTGNWLGDGQSDSDCLIHSFIRSWARSAPASGNKPPLDLPNQLVVLSEVHLLLPDVKSHHLYRSAASRRAGRRHSNPDCLPSRPFRRGISCGNIMTAARSTRVYCNS